MLCRSKWRHENSRNPEKQRSGTQLETRFIIAQKERERLRAKPATSDRSVHSEDYSFTILISAHLSICTLRSIIAGGFSCRSLARSTPLGKRPQSVNRFRKVAAKREADFFARAKYDPPRRCRIAAVRSIGGLRSVKFSIAQVIPHARTHIRTHRRGRALPLFAHACYYFFPPSRRSAQYNSSSRGARPRRYTW